MPMIPLPTPHVIAAQGTHPGETGKNNEDSLAVAAWQDTKGGQPVTLAIIADGIGGSRAGEVASALVVKTVLDAVSQSSGPDYRGVLDLALTATAMVLADHAREPDTYGMGSTCALALVAGRRLYTAYLGDSRLYLVRGHTIRQTSIDHTWVEEAIQAGVITRDEARTHPNRHVVRRHLGLDPNARPDFRLRLYSEEQPRDSTNNQGLPLEPGDQVLVCSDGLSDLVEMDEMLDRMLRLEPAEAVEQLILLARQRGGHDNISLIILRLPALRRA